MIYYINYTKDIIGNNYLVINFPMDTINPFLEDMRDIIDDDIIYDTFVENQQKRDHGSHHLTVINVTEYNDLAKKMGMDKFINSLESVFKYEIDDLKMMGVGTAAKNENRSYFIVCKSEKIDAIRKRYELPQKDLHITLGFKFKDVFGVKKNVVIEKEGKFLKLLRQEFYKKENWDFVKKIGNFDLNPESEVIPISISSKGIKVKCDNYYLFIINLDDNKFWIASQFKVDEELPRMSETEISKIL